MKSLKKKSKYKTITRKKIENKKKIQIKKNQKGGSGSDKIIYDCKCKMIEGDSSQASKINISHTSQQEFQDYQLKIINEIKKKDGQNRVLKKENIEQRREIKILNDELIKKNEYIEKIGNIIENINKEFEDEKKKLIKKITVLELKDTLLETNRESSNIQHQNEIKKLENSHETEKKLFMARINKIYETVDEKMKAILLQRRDFNIKNGELLNNNVHGNPSQISQHFTKLEELMQDIDCSNIANGNGEITEEFGKLKHMLEEMKKNYSVKI